MAWNMIKPSYTPLLQSPSTIPSAYALDLVIHDLKGSSGCKKVRTATDKYILHDPFYLTLLLTYRHDRTEPAREHCHQLPWWVLGWGMDGWLTCPSLSA